MARRSSQANPAATETEESTAPEAPAAPAAKDPVSLEVQTSTEDSTPAPAATPEKIQTDFREKLLNKDIDRDIFVPSNPAALEKAAGEVAKDKGFELNRGTSIGARLMARANKSI